MKKRFAVKLANVAKRQALAEKKKQEDSALLATVVRSAELMIKQSKVLEFLSEIYSADPVAPGFVTSCVVHRPPEDRYYCSIVRYDTGEAYSTKTVVAASYGETLEDATERTIGLWLAKHPTMAAGMNLRRTLRMPQSAVEAKLDEFVVEPPVREVTQRSLGRRGR